MADPWEARPEDYYDLLGLSRHSRDFAEVLEGAYNRLIRKYHPDRAAEADKQRFTEESAKLNVAYQVLKDPETRRRYDDWLDHEGGYETVHGPAASSQGHSHASGSAGGTAGGQSSASPPPPHLAADPASLDFDAIPAGQPAGITLWIRNVGGPCSDDLFRIRDHRHPAHPNHDPNHWLTISAPQPFPSPSQGTVSVQCEAHTARLVPGRTYTADVYIDYCGDTYRLPVKITAPTLKNHPYKAPALAAAALVALIILVVLVKSAFSGSATSPPVAESRPISAVQPTSAAQPPPPPTAPPTPSNAQLLVLITTPDEPIKNQNVDILAQETNAVGAVLRGHGITNKSTDASGLATFTLQPGKYFVQTSLPGYGWAQVNDDHGIPNDMPVELAAGDSKTITIALGTLDIMGYTATGQPLKDTTINVWSRTANTTGPGFSSGITDSTGFLRLHLTPGTYTIGESRKTIPNVTIQPGQTNSINFTLPPPTQ